MSFHGGVIGTSLAMIVLARRKGLDWLRVHDYVACCVPFGLFLGRIADFLNGELWGKPSNVAWAIIFPLTGDYVQRPPHQLHDTGLAGPARLAGPWFLFCRTQRTSA